MAAERAKLAHALEGSGADRVEVRLTGGAARHARRLTGEVYIWANGPFLEADTKPPVELTEFGELRVEGVKIFVDSEISGSPRRPNGPLSARTRGRGRGEIVRACRDALRSDERLARMQEICCALPEAACERSGRHAVFRVRKRTFAYFLDNHRGDEGIVGAVFKLEATEETEALLASSSARFYRPAYVGPKGWLGVRLDAGPIDWDELAGFLEESYARVAPKSLGRRLRV